jgi:elongation factor Ts
MADITAAMVKELRDKTDAGMMDCKKALAESNGDMAAAVEYLRKTGVTKAEKRSGKTVKEGKIFALSTGSAAILTEVLSETDFVATNEKFFAYVKAASDRVFKATAGSDGDVAAKAQELEKENLVNLIAVIGENIQLRRAFRYETSGKIATYLHLGGKIGVMVDVEGETTPELLNDICLHIAAFKPQYVRPEEIPAEAVAKEKEIASAQVTGKPANIVEKIVSGKIQKWYGDVCLVKQPWIKDDKTTLEKLAPKLKVKRFVRWEVGQEL